MFAGAAVVWSLVFQSSTILQPSACSQALGAEMGAGAVEICLGEEQAKLGDAAQKDSPERTRAWQSAVEQFRRAINLPSTIEVKFVRSMRSQGLTTRSTSTTLTR